MERPSECVAKECQNKNGRNYTSTANPLILCSTCGSIAMHKQCLPHPRKGRFHCADCTIAFQKDDRDDENALLYDNEVEEIDVCHVSDNEDLNIVERLLCDDGTQNETEQDSDSDCENIKISHRRRTRILSSDSNNSDAPKKPTMSLDLIVTSSSDKVDAASDRRLDMCFLCKSSKKDEFQYGDFLKNEEMEMAVHTFCLYLSSNLAQNGADEEGFLGFLKGDIKKEAMRVSYLVSVVVLLNFRIKVMDELKIQPVFIFSRNVVIVVVTLYLMPCSYRKLFALYSSFNIERQINYLITLIAVGGRIQNCKLTCRND
ncbi:uncharacterized protein [Musca autumnalis]|uniref:uncharacterized protein n=1 Tax=Musca autumnalis TaxID=221902 RepID=UPI003CF1D425